MRRRTLQIPSQLYLFWAFAFLMGRLSGEPIRVALIPFSVDENSFRSERAAGDFTFALQAQLATDAEVQWVERGDLAKAERELQLGSGGYVARTDAARAGRLAGAEWAVYGRFSTNAPDSSRTLRLELVDLIHAESLSETNITIPGEPFAPLRFNADTTTTTARTLDAWLRRQRALSSQITSAIRVAVLPIVINFTADAEDQATNLASQVVAGLKTNSAGTPSRAFQLTRASRSIDEAELALLGLAESDREAASKASDWYVWGYADELDRMQFDNASKQFKMDRVAPIRLTLWDGRGGPRDLGETRYTNAPMAEIAMDIQRRIQAALAASPHTNRTDDNARRAASESLRVSGDSVARHVVGLDLPVRLNMWFEALDCYDVACFFDPGNAAARFAWVKTRYNLYDSSNYRNPYRFRRAGAPAWGNYVDRFGFGATNTLPRSAESQRSFIVRHYLRLLFDSLEDSENDGRPADASIAELAGRRAENALELARRWIATRGLPEATPFAKQVARSLAPANYEPQPAPHAVERLAAVRDACERDPAVLPAVMDVLTKLGADAGQAGDAGRFAARLQESAGKENAERLRAARALISSNAVHAPLPRIRVLHADERLNPFEGADLAFPLPILEPPIEDVRFPGGSALGVRYMAGLGATAGFITVGKEDAAIMANDPLLANDVRAAQSEVQRLWLAGDDSPEARLVAVPGPDQRFNGMAAGAGALWIGRERGADRFDPGSAKWLSETDDPKLGLQRGIAQAGADIFSIRGGIRRWENSPLQWGGATLLAGAPPMFGADVPTLVAGAGHWLLASLHWEPWLIDLAGNTCAPVTNLPIGPVIALASAGSTSFWMGGSSGFSRFDAQTKGVSSQVYERPLAEFPEEFGSRFRSIRNRTQSPNIAWQRAMAEKMARRERSPLPLSRLPGGVRSMAVDGDFLWLAVSEEESVYRARRVCLWHAPSESWVATFQARTWITSLAVSAGYLWIGYESGVQDAAVARVNRKALIDTPRERWVPGAISKIEIDSQLSSMNESARAMFGLFHGDPQPYIGLHETGDPDALPAETLYFLAAAWDRHGANNPELSARYLRSLEENYPGSPYASATRPTWRDPAGYSDAPIDRAKRLIARFDWDGDQTLSYAEFESLLSESPGEIRSASGPGEGSGSDQSVARSTYSMIHRSDPRRGMTADELAGWLLKKPASVARPGPFPPRGFNGARPFIRPNERPSPQ